MCHHFFVTLLKLTQPWKSTHFDGIHREKIGIFYGYVSLPEGEELWVVKQTMRVTSKKKVCKTRRTPPMLGEILSTSSNSMGFSGKKQADVVRGQQSSWWFKSWPFYPLVGGHLHFEFGSRITIPRKGHQQNCQVVDGFVHNPVEKQLSCQMSIKFSVFTNWPAWNIPLWHSMKSWLVYRDPYIGL